MSKSVIKNSRKIHSHVNEIDPTINSRITVLENNVYKITYYEIISGTSGSLTIPAGATINSGEFGLSGNSILSKINVSNKPTYESPKTAGGTIVTANLATNGTWTTSGVYTDPQVALIYSINISAKNYGNLNNFYIIESEEIDGDNVKGPNTSVDNSIARYDGTTGKLIQTSPLIIDDNGGIITPGESSPAFTAKSIRYDNTINQWIMTDNDSATMLNVGYETWFICQNNTGSTIANGQAVFVSNTSGGIPTIALAKADSASTAVGIGITTEAIPNGATGKVTQSGLVNGVDTSALTGGAVYVSATVAGGLTNTAPVAPNYRMRVGFVGIINSTTGSILVTPSTGALGNGTANQVFGMNNAGTAQEVKSIVAAANSGLAINNTTNQIAIDNIAVVDISLTATIVGWASYTTQSVKYQDLGDCYRVDISLSGTSNSGSATVALPFNHNSAQISGTPYILNNGSANAGRLTVNNASNIVQFQSNVAGNTWTTTGLKQVMTTVFIYK